MCRSLCSNGAVDAFAQVVHVRAQGVGIGEEIAPEFVFELLAADQAGGFAHQYLENAHGGWRQSHTLAVALDAHGTGIENQVADSHRAIGHLTACPAHQGSDSGGQFFHFEGLDQVIVGAGIETGDLVAELVTGRQHQNGRAVAPLSQALADPDAIDLRQHQVEK